MALPIAAASPAGLFAWRLWAALAPLGVDFLIPVLCAPSLPACSVSGKRLRPYLELASRHRLRRLMAECMPSLWELPRWAGQSGLMHSTEAFNRDAGPGHACMQPASHGWHGISAAPHLAAVSCCHRSAAATRCPLPPAPQGRGAAAPAATGRPRGRSAVPLHFQPQAGGGGGPCGQLRLPGVWGGATRAL